MKTKKRKLLVWEKNFLIENKIFDFSLLNDFEGPVEYFVKKAKFMDKWFYVDENVLIPRIETEKLVNLSIFFLKKYFFYKKQNFFVADVGTGSGVIGINFIDLFLKLFSHDQKFLHIYFIDIKQKALEIAKKNFLSFFENFELKETSKNIYFLEFLNKKIYVYFVVSDLFTKVSQNQFDLVISNPPYIPKKDEKTLDKSVVDFEPHEALFSQTKHFFINKILETDFKETVYLFEVHHDLNILNLKKDFYYSFFFDFNDKLRYIKAVKDDKIFL